MRRRLAKPLPHRMKFALTPFREKGVSSVIFGDIFLEDLKKYREEKVARVGMEAVFPLWKRDTASLARAFIDAGFKAIITCVDSKSIGGEFSGREYDHKFLEDLPSSADPCGENGEFHSFVYDGPIFSKPISLKRGEKVLRDERFHYCDLLPQHP